VAPGLQSVFTVFSRFVKVASNVTREAVTFLWLSALQILCLALMRSFSVKIIFPFDVLTYFEAVLKGS
jgi:hypothetical protein